MGKGKKKSTRLKLKGGPPVVRRTWAIKPQSRMKTETRKKRLEKLKEKEAGDWRE